MRIAALFSALSLFLGVSISNAYAEGDVAEGERLAREICTRCHNVELGGPFKQYPPSFSAIAIYRSAEDIRWKIIAPPLHSGMPQVGHYLTPDNVEHLIAYIASLEKQ